MLWWLRSDGRLSERAHQLIVDGRTQLLWSLASSWEIAIKVSVGKLELRRPLADFFAELLEEQHLDLLSLRHEHLTQVANLPLIHRDPFDRMIVAQAQFEGVSILTADSKLSRYAVETIF